MKRRQCECEDESATTRLKGMEQGPEEKSYLWGSQDFSKPPSRQFFLPIHRKQKYNMFMRINSSCEHNPRQLGNLVLLARPCHQKSTLLQGQKFDGGEDGQVELFSSENGIFKLQFDYVSPLGNFSNLYLGIWYNYQDGPPVWIANRNSPFRLESPALTIDNTGSFKILHSGREPFILYEYEPATNNSHNTSATLEDSGNLVLHQLNPDDGSKEKILWQSFDHPTDTLLPGMKIGIYHKTGRIWSLTSARSTLSPAAGSFTFGMDPNATTQLVIWQRGKVFWRSGVWKNGGFSDMRKASTFNRAYNFSYFTSENETYFHYSLVDRAISLFPLLSIDVDGSIRGFRYGRDSVQVYCGQPYNGIGCVPLEMPECRISNGELKFGFHSHVGFMSREGFRYSNTENLTLEDCKGMCLSACSCAAYATSNEDRTGCEIWNSTFSFRESPFSDHSRFIYFSDQDQGDRKINLKNLFGIMDQNALPKTLNGMAETLGDYNTHNVLRCIHIGLLCVQDQPTDRPTMSDVVAMLSNETSELPDPKQPAFLASAVVEEIDVLELNDQNCSRNTVTITVMQAR
ncbi:unnamed protein product [Linum tenue]|uniref:Uncharacterized protein n=1 Tax=Linum tenue TaxID=586396 RepID=A0AAV0KPV9_9ROSI|nr:unnamed protein product [Linum tenue]